VVAPAARTPSLRSVPLSVEFTVEPFVDGEPGPHVRAAVDVAQASGLTTEFGPFGTTMSGEDAAVLTAIDDVVRAALSAGATRLAVQIEREP
jgi:uncharacterized protein YqgV (UPF0045/DUF77 family)